MNWKEEPCLKVNEVFDGNKMFYDSIDLWTIAVRQNGTWVNYYTKIMPTSEPAKESRRVIETDRFMVLYESCSVDDFSKILKALESEKMNVCGLDIKHDVAKNYHSDQDMDYLYRKWAIEQFRTEYPLYKYEIRPSLNPKLPRDSETQFLSLGKPYKDHWDVMHELIRIKSSSYNSGSVCILLPIFVSLRECFFDQNALRFTAEFHKKMASQVVLGFILRNSKGESRRYSRPLNKDMLKFSGDFCLYKDHEPVDDDIISAEVIVHHNEIPFIVNSKEAIRFGLSTPLEMFKKFWSEEYLLECLSGERRDKAFEWSVSTLLTFCGFEVLWIGWGKGRIALGGADLLALYRDTITIGECTTGTVRTEKIDKLLGVVQTVHETLGLREKSTQKIFPLIFTCSEVSSATRESSRKSGVRIRGPEEIMQIYDAIKKNKPTQEIVSLVRGNEYYL